MHYVMGRSKEHCMTGYLAAKAPLSSSRVRLPSGALTDLLPSPRRASSLAQEVIKHYEQAVKLRPDYLPISPHMPYLACARLDSPLSINQPCLSRSSLSSHTASRAVAMALGAACVGPAARRASTGPGRRGGLW